MCPKRLGRAPVKSDHLRLVTSIITLLSNDSLSLTPAKAPTVMIRVGQTVITKPSIDFGRS